MQCGAMLGGRDPHRQSDDSHKATDTSVMVDPGRHTAADPPTLHTLNPFTFSTSFNVDDA